MKLIAHRDFCKGGTIRQLQLLHGDLVEIPPEHAVDVLILSALPGDYLPTTSSLIGALYRKGLDVGTLAKRKEKDLRDSFSCWLSEAIEPRITGLEFKRILCFESAIRGPAPELIGDIFRCLAPFTFAEPNIQTMAMPVLAAGDQGYAFEKMLRAMVCVAMEWLSRDFPLQTIKMVVRSDAYVAEAITVFEDEVARFDVKFGGGKGGGPEVENSRQHDIFLSYSRRDEDAAKEIVEAFDKNGIRVFFDRISIDIGSPWQASIYKAIQECRGFVALYSPEFVMSKNCQEEIQAALHMRLTVDRYHFFPILLRSAALPLHMSMYQYINCCEDDRMRMRNAAEAFSAKLREP